MESLSLISNFSSPYDEVQHDGQLLCDEEITLPYLLTRMVRANWKEFRALRELLLSNFKDSEYIPVAKSMKIGIASCDKFLELLENDHFSSDWNSIAEDIFLNILVYLASYSANYEMREYAFFTAMRIIGNVTKQPCQSHFARLNMQRAVELRKLDFILNIAKPDSLSRQLAIEELLQCADNGPGHLSKGKARVGLRKVASYLTKGQVEEDLSAQDPMVRQRAIKLLGWVNGRFAVTVLLNSYLKCDSKERALILATLRAHHQLSYRKEAGKLLERDSIGYAPLKLLCS